jgi:hypothetical protein
MIKIEIKNPSIISRIKRILVEKEEIHLRIREGKTPGVSKKKIWLSIRKRESCLFSRRSGLTGNLLFGYSICFRLFWLTNLR